MTTPKQALAKNEKSINSAVDRIRDIFGTTLAPKEMVKIGNEAAKMVRIRTRLGYGVERDDAPRQRLLPLSSLYIERRRELAADGDLSEFTKPGKSNLTLTGQMLNSLQVIAARKGNVAISPKGSRFDSELTNEQVSIFVQEQGRPYLNLSNLEIKKLARFYQNTIMKPKLAKV